MKKWKAILFGTLLTLSLCTFTACGTEVNNADETVDEKDTNENTAAEDETIERKPGSDPSRRKPWKKKQTMTV